MSNLVDLHIHSNLSCDGDFSPRELVQFAKDKAFRAISISDHDTVAAYPEAVLLGEEADVEVIPGIEVTTLFGEREFHLLLPFIDWRSEPVSEITGRMNKSRLCEAKERVKKLNENHIRLEWDEVWEKSGGIPPLGVKIAQLLLERPDSRDDPKLARYFRGTDTDFAPYQFYRDYFMEGKPAFVPKRHISLLDVLEKSRGTGGVPVLAHPGAYFQQTTEEDLILLKSKGLVGLEVYTFYHTAAQVNLYRRVAQDLDLVPTAGSDFHGKIKPHVAFGALVDGEYWMVEELKKRRAH
jgi:hypothetical protein